MKLRWGIRFFLLALAGAYLFFMVLSHSTPLSPDLELPLALAGWLPCVAGVAVIGTREKRWPGLGPRPSLRQVLAPMRARRGIHLFGAVMLVVLAACAAEALQGNRQDSCRSQDPAGCVKLDQWSAKGGLYFGSSPYDAARNGDPNAPWVQISRTEYVAEVGTRLRSAAGFGLLALGIASFLSVLEEGTALSRRPRKGELRLANYLPRPDSS